MNPGPLGACTNTPSSAIPILSVYNNGNVKMRKSQERISYKFIKTSKGMEDLSNVRTLKIAKKSLF